MKNLIAILAFVLSSQAQAQLGSNYQGNNPGYQGEVLVPVQTVQPVQESAAVANPQTASGNQIYILNTQRTNAQARQGQVQEQPVTVVQEAPLKPSAGDAFRNRRKNEESATEDGIVQALERARLDDEVKRRDKFNSAIGSGPTAATSAGQSNGSTIVGDNNVVSQSQVVQQPVAQVQVAPVRPVVQEVIPVPVATPKTRIHVVSETVTDDGPDIAADDERYERRQRRDYRDDRRDDSVHNELRAAFAERRDERQSYYVGALATFGNYDNVINVSRSMGYGVVVGTQTTDRIVAEGSFTYANYQLEDVYNSFNSGGCCSALVVDMRQMNFAAAAKYVLLPGKFRPSAGAALSYTRRSYSYYDNDFRTSDALDVAGVLGADLQLSDGFAIGVDFKYFTNLGYRQNTNRTQSFVYAQQRNDPETLDYYMVNLVGKFTF